MNARKLAILYIFLVSSFAISQCRPARDIAHAQGPDESQSIAQCWEDQYNIARSRAAADHDAASHNRESYLQERDSGQNLQRERDDLRRENSRLRGMIANLQRTELQNKQSAKQSAVAVSVKPTIPTVSMQFGIYNTTKISVDSCKMQAITSLQKRGARLRRAFDNAIEVDLDDREVIIYCRTDGTGVVTVAGPAPDGLDTLAVELKNQLFP